MANSNSLEGFIPVQYKSGKRYVGAANLYYKSTTANTPIAVGDPVIRIASTDANGYPEIQRATAGAAVTGHVVGIKLITSDLTKQSYLAAGDIGYVWVCDDPDVLLRVQEGGASTALAAAQIGKHIDANISDANTDTGKSNCYLDNAAVATGNTYRIERLSQEATNSMGQYAKWDVLVNLSTEVNAGASNLSETA